MKDERVAICLTSPHGQSCTTRPRSATVPVMTLYRIDLLLRASLDEEALHEILIRANTYAIVEAVDAILENDDGNCHFTARIDAPSPQSALGSVLTVLAQISGHIGLVEEGSLRRVTIECEEPVSASG
jgi:hypothetical protein